MPIKHTKRAARMVWMDFRIGFRQLIFEADTRLTEVSSGIMLLGWGAILTFPSPGDSGVSDVQRQMITLAPLWVWGVFVMALGFLQGLGATFFMWTPIRAFTAAIAGPCWGFFSLVIAVAGYRVVGFLAYALMALLVSWAYVRLGAGILRKPAKTLFTAVVDRARKPHGG